MRVFMAEDNICSQNLLKLVSHGNAIIAELLRLKDHIPSMFSAKQIQNKYQDVIMDFSYFKISDTQEKKISSIPKLQELDDDIKESTLELITRIYLSLESIYQYSTDVNNFIEQLNEGAFIQQSVESIMLDAEGKQLLCESLYLYGCMLLLVDQYMPGAVRERLLVAFYRYSTSQSQTNVDAVCTLLRDTGCSHSKRPAHYPSEYFSRIPMNPDLINAVIGKLRSEDIYNQLSVYPLPEQRSTALAAQATMLFVSLFFCPKYLHSDMTTMREIVDKFFVDNWVISIYMGVTLSVVDFWDGFKAAKSALANTCNNKTVKIASEKYVKSVPKFTTKIKHLLKEGNLTEDDLLDNTNKIIGHLRESNISLRWLILHTCQTTFSDNCRTSKQLKDVVVKETDESCLSLLQLLISTAELEVKVREMLTSLLKSRTDMWIEYKKRALEGIAELTDLLSGPKQTSKITKNEQLKLWFDNIAKQISSLGDIITTKSTKKVIQLMQALDKVVEFHNLRSVSSILQELSETQDALKNALRISNLREDSLVALEICSDVSYVWCSVDVYTSHMQDMIKRNPSVTSRLRALFLKLAGAMDIPLLRINQAHSEDLISVSQYYSRELVVYIQTVLQVIPEMVFNILEKIIEVQTWKLKEIPTRLEKDRLREFAQLKERMEVARLTHSASTFTKGILDMRTTLVGVVRIDPAELLEAGLQNELARHIRSKFEELIEKAPGKRGTYNTSNLLARLETLANSMDGYKRSLEYIQDYINIHGLKIWQKQMICIISASVGAEVSARRGVLASAAPAGFMGSLARQIAQFCDARFCTYVSIRAAWFDSKTHLEVVDSKTFANLNNAIGAMGLHGLDTLYAFMIKTQLQTIVDTFNTQITKEKAWIELNKGKKNMLRDVEAMQQIKSTQQIADALVSIGTLQTIRRHISFQLSTSAKFDSVHLEASLRAMNEALVNELKQDSRTDAKQRVSTELLHTLDEHLMRCGCYNPHEKIYLRDMQEQSFNLDAPYIMALVVSSQLHRLQLCGSTGDLIVKRLGDNIDGYPLLVGVYTLLKQYRHDYIIDFVDNICEYMTQQSYSSIKSKSSELSQDVVSLVHLLEQFCHEFQLSLKCVENKLPITLLTLTSAK